MPRVSITLLSVVLALPGCQPASPGPLARGPEGSARTPPLASIDGAVLGDTDWGTFGSHRFSVELTLPERSRWTVDDRSERWLVAEHGPSQSVLRIRTWVASRLVRPEECAEQARLWTGGTPDTPESAVERRRLQVPEGFRTELTVGVTPLVAGRYQGYAVAFGASVGRCYAAIYTTVATGDRALDVIGRRLAVITDGVLARVSNLGIDQRAGQLEPR